MWKRVVGTGYPFLINRKSDEGVVRVKDFDTDVLDEALRRTLKVFGLWEVYHFSKIFRHWDIIIGEPLSFKTAPKRLVKKILTITVEDATYAHHLRFFVDTIIEHIASPAICGDNVVKRIKFQVGEVKANRFVMLKEIRNSWESILSSPLAKCCSAEQLIDDRLVILVPSSYRDDLKDMGREILFRVRQRCDHKNVVNKIEFREIKDSQAFRSGKIGREAYGNILKRNAREFDRFKSKHHNTLNQISDPDLREQFARLMKSMLSLRK